MIIRIIRGPGWGNWFWELWDHEPPENPVMSYGCLAHGQAMTRRAALRRARRCQRRGIPNRHQEIYTAEVFR